MKERGLRLPTMTPMWWYTLLVLVIWVVNSELRRIQDLFLGFSQVEILAVLPLASIIPHTWSLFYGGGVRRLPPILAITAWIWLGGFTYALFIAIYSGNIAPGLYEFVTFVLPMGFGLWIAADRADFTTAYRRIVVTLIGLATLTSIYGIIQYVAPPIWDLAWLNSVIKVGVVSFGRAAPFQIRVFSTLNESGTFAFFLAAVMLFSLPELSLKKPLLLLAVPVWLIAIVLTLVRTGWIAFGIGLLIYLALSPRRLTLIGALAVTVSICGFLAVALPAAIGNETVLTSLTARFETFSDLDQDTSANARRGLYADGLSIVGNNPFGTGLGQLGTATKIGAAQTATDFDSAYLGRLFEMGLPGTILYLIPQAICLVGSAILWFRSKSRGDVRSQSIASASVAMLGALLFIQLGHDVNGIFLLLFWTISCVVLRATASNAAPSPWQVPIQGALSRT